MPERKFPVVNFRSPEYLLGIPQQHDLADILMDFPQPFGISHAPDLQQGIDTYELGLWDGDSDVVYLGVNHNPYSGNVHPEPAGLFYLERQNRRMLYDPEAAIPLRDSYRGFYQNDFGTTARLSDLIGIVLAKEVPLYQITSLFQIPGVKDFLQPQMMRRLHTGSAIAQPYRVEGSLKLEAVMQQRLHPVQPITSSAEIDLILNNRA